MGKVGRIDSVVRWMHKTGDLCTTHLAEKSFFVVIVEYSVSEFSIYVYVDKHK